MRLLSETLFRPGVRSVRIHPSGCLAAAATSDGALACWTLGRHGALSLVWEKKLRRRCVFGLTFSPDGRYLVASGSGPVRAWRVTDRAGRLTIEDEPLPDWSSHSTLFLDDHTLLSLFPTDDPRPAIIHLDTRRASELRLWSNCGAVHPEGKLLLLSQYFPSGQSKLAFAWWDPERSGLTRSSVELGATDEQATPVGPVAFHPSGDQFAVMAGRPDRFKVHVCDFPPRRTLYRRAYPLTARESWRAAEAFPNDWEDFDCYVERFVYLSDGRLLAPTPDGKLVCLESASGEEVERHQVHAGLFATLDNHAARRLVLTGGTLDGLVKVWRLASGRARAERSHGMCRAFREREMNRQGDRL